LLTPSVINTNTSSGQDLAGHLVEHEPVIGTDGARHDIRLGMVFGCLGRDLTAIDELLHEGMVARHR
jgi:hypothetical protein